MLDNTMLAWSDIDRKRKEKPKGKEVIIMKAEVRFFAKGFASATVPEIPELRVGRWRKG